MTVRLDVEVLLAHVLGKPRSYLYAHPEQQLTPAQKIHFLWLWQRRLRGEPIAYILGEKMFWKHTFYVNRYCLVPRPETELLVDKTLQTLSDDKPYRLLELGTGSGAVALSLAQERPHWTIVATDNSKEALAVAKRNASRLSVDNVQFCLSHWFDQLTVFQSMPFDAVIANPPYIVEDDPHLNSEGVCFEPRYALVAGEQGMADLNAIIGGAKAYLVPGGWLAVEHGYHQGGATRYRFGACQFNNIKTHCDINGAERLTEGVI